MITKNNLKLIQSLKQQKHRKESQLFVVEGRKMVEELQASDFEVVYNLATESYLAAHPEQQEIYDSVTDKQMEQISSQTTAPGVLSVAKIPNKPFKADTAQEIVLVLDGISNPGNMGTIIRTSEWFGIKNIVCSEDCVEFWNPKVIQSTMGSIYRTYLTTCDLKDLLSSEKAKATPIFGALLEGEDIYQMQQNPESGILVIGSESHGIREDILPYITHPIHIPCAHGNRAESLNASMATGIILSEFFRRKR